MPGTGWPWCSTLPSFKRWNRSAGNTSSHTWETLLLIPCAQPTWRLTYCRSRTVQCLSSEFMCPIAVVVPLQAWSKAVKQSRTRKKAKKSSTAPAAELLQDPAVQPALQALTAVQTALGSCLQAVILSCADILSTQQSTMEANVLAQYDPSSNQDVLMLMGWEERVSVQHVLVDAVKAQRQIVEQVRGTAEKLGKRAHQLTW